MSNQSPFKTVTHTADLCVVGGGLAGTIAALSAARHGARVVLMQDRPMLGGNSSSEIRMWVRGAEGKYNRETGILAEFEEENIYRNPTLAPTLWDSVLYGKVKENENITLLLNTSCLDATCEDGEITSVTGWQLTTYSYHKVEATYFADCSGDSVLAPLTGALHRIGREASREYGESIGHEQADSRTMGMSLLLQARETDHPVPFIPPTWANVYETDEDFSPVPHGAGQYAIIRDQRIATDGCNLWWMELGGDGEAIANTEETRDELLRVAFGVWDHLKNRQDHGYANWELEWVGFLPGKRESVRYIGHHVLTQGDVEAGGVFEDVVAYGGWPMDDHDPRGIRAVGDGAAPSRMYPAPSPYGIPYRCLYSKNIRNLFFAGRNISATHAAMSSTRVMATCSLLGQAVGTAAALCCRDGLMPAELTGERVAELQQTLLTDGVFLPGVKRAVPPLTKAATLNLSEAERAILQNGVERPRPNSPRNHITLEKGSKLTFSFPKTIAMTTLRLQFDPDFERASISPHHEVRQFAQKAHTGLDFQPVKVAATVAKSFTVSIDGKEIYKTDNNYRSLVNVPLTAGCRVTVRFNDTHGAEKVNLFACDLA